MRCILITLLALAAVASAACRVYDVDVYQNVNSKAAAADGIAQSFTCTVDSLLWASIFIGAANPSGQYHFEIQTPEGQKLYERDTSAGPNINYKFVRADLVPEPGAQRLIKGKTYVLKVTLTNPYPDDSINFYYSDQNPYNYGHLIEPGQDQNHPEEYYWKDLSCRIEGIVYNNPEMVGTWDEIPKHFVDPYWLGEVHQRYDPAVESVMIGQAAENMQALGVRGVRIIDCWDEVQPDSTTPNVFKWDTGVDWTWRAFVSQGIRPHVVMHSSAKWPLWRPYNPQWWNYFPFPTQLFEPVALPVDSGGMQINRENHLAWFLYSYAKRYGPEGYSKNGEKTGTFWDENGDLTPLPLLFVECLNEPADRWGADWWDSMYTLRDDSVTRIRTNLGLDLGWAYVYSRFCVVAESALKFASDSISAEFYCTTTSTHYTLDDWLDALWNYGAGGFLKYVSFHAHLSPTEAANDSVDTVYAALRRHNMADKTVVIGEGGEADQSWVNHNEPRGDWWKAKVLAEAFTTFWARNADPRKPVSYYDWQSYSQWFVKDDGPPYYYRWGITDPSFTAYPSAAALRQVTDMLSGKQFIRRFDPLPGVDTGVAAFEFQNTAGSDSSRIWVVWRKSASPGEDPRAVSIPVRTAAADTTTVDVGQTPEAQSIQAATDGYAECSVGKSPVFIEEAAVSQISRPDLAVESIWTSIIPTPSWPQQRRLWAKVRNVGNAWSSAVSGFAQEPAPVKFYANGNLAGEVSQMPGIQPGEAIYVQSDGLWQISSSGEYLVKVIANENQTFVELSWENNARYKLFLIQAVYAVDGGASGRRTIVRSSYSSPTQAVTEFTQSGNPLVFYCPSLDSATSGWDSLTVGQWPAVSLDGAGRPWVVSVRRDTSEALCAEICRADSSFKKVTVYCAPSGQHLGPPSLGVFQGASGRLGNVALACYEPAATGHSMILFLSFDSTGNDIKLDTIDDFPGSYGDSAACLVTGLTDSIAVAYGRADTVFLRRLRYSPNDHNPPAIWSSPSMVNEMGVSAYHPSCERIGSDARLWVAYSQRSVDTATKETSWAIIRTSCCDTMPIISWEGTAAVSSQDEQVKDFPSLSTPRSVAWVEGSSTTSNWVIKAKVGDSLLTLTNDDTSCKFVSILCDTAVQTSPSTSTTGVYYTWLQQYSGDTWAVNYASKQVQTSNADANVTMYNQGRKLVLDDNDTLHAVYRTNQGSLYYSKKKDGVEGWTSSLLRSTGDMPAVDVDYLNRVYVADRDFDKYTGGATIPDVIRCQTRAAGSGTWTGCQVYSSQLAYNGAGAPVHKIGPPAIAACLNDTGDENRSAAYIVYTVYEPGLMNARSTICMAKVNTSGVVYVDTLRWVSGAGDSYPSISLCPVAGEGYSIHVSWQEGTEVYTKKATSLDQPQFTSKRTWSGNYNLSSTGSRSKHPQVACDDTVLVAWVEGDSGVITVKGQGPGSSYDAWGSAVNVSACPDTCCDNPSIALGDSIIVTYHKKLSATNYDIIARVNFHSDINLSNSSTTSSKYPHCVFHLHNDSFPVISTVWTEELSPNYAGIGYKRWQLGEEDGGGIQDFSIFDPNIHPALFAPAPNPFNGMTSIRYATNVKGLTRVTVMDITGRRVRNLLTMPQSPGIYNLTWNARDDRERLLPRGVYFVRLETPNYHEARKLILTE